MDQRWNPPESAENPWSVLGIASGADDREIRAAYLSKVREFPPDKRPDDFERIRDAYEILSNPRRRAAMTLLAADPWAPLASLLDDRPPRKRFVGPAPWLSVLKEETLARGEGE